MKSVVKSIKLLGIFIILTGSVSLSQAFTNGKIACTLDNGTVVEFNVNNCSAHIKTWVPGGIFASGGWGIDFSMTGRGILNRCISRNGRNNLHLDYDNRRVYNGTKSSDASCEAW